MVTSATHDVFISYSRRDKVFVERLHGALKQAGQSAWIDWIGIPVTSDWWAEIERGIEGADTFVFVMSPDSLESEYCQKEVLHAMQHNKRLVPIVHRDCESNLEADNAAHQALRRHHWLMFRAGDDFAPAFGELVGAIETDLAHVKEHTRLLGLALEWERRGRSDGMLLGADALIAAETWLGEGAQKDPEPTEAQRNYIRQSRAVEEDRHRRERLLVAAKKRATGITVGAVGLAVVSIAGAGYGMNSLRLERDKIQAETAVAKQAKQQAEEDKRQAIVAKDAAQKEKQQAEKSAKDAKQQQKIALNEKQKAQQAKQQAERQRGFAENASKQAKANLVIAQRKQQAADGRAREADRKAQDANRQAEVAGRDRDLANREKREANQLRKIARREARLAQIGSRLERAGTEAIERFKFDQTGAALIALRAGRELSDVVTAYESKSIAAWPAVNPLLSLHQLAPRMRFTQKTLEGHGDIVWHGTFSPDGQRILTTSWDKTARLWDASGRLITKLEGHGDIVLHGTFSPDGQRILTTSWDKTARLWDANGRLITKLEGHGDSVWHGTFSPDGQRILTTSSDKTARLWDANGRLITKLEGHGSSVGHGTFSPDGQRILTTSSDKTARLWDANGRLITKLEGHGDIV
ncbi:TIR domain-containing protein, partial [filamentous cyanobacterium LEGE 11480]